MADSSRPHRAGAGAAGDAHRDDDDGADDDEDDSDASVVSELDVEDTIAAEEAQGGAADPTDELAELQDDAAL